jgi:hypothetical protein
VRESTAGWWLISQANRALVKGFIRVHWRGFRGDDLGSPRFDRCSAGLTQLIRSLASMTLIKNLGRHTDHAAQRRTVAGMAAPREFAEQCGGMIPMCVVAWIPL